MKLTVKREPAPGATPGRLLVNGAFECWTLEDEVRDGPKVPGKTAIPAGTYDVTVTMSARFKCLMPLVNNVPGFTGIRIHSGHTVEDTAGCLLLGDVRKQNTVLFSKSAYKRVYEKIVAATNAGEKVTITYI